MTLRSSLAESLSSFAAAGHDESRWIERVDDEELVDRKVVFRSDLND